MSRLFKIILVSFVTIVAFILGFLWMFAGAMGLAGTQAAGGEVVAYSMFFGGFAVILAGWFFTVRAIVKHF